MSVSEWEWDVWEVEVELVLVFERWGSGGEDVVVVVANGEPGLLFNLILSFPLRPFIRSLFHGPPLFPPFVFQNSTKLKVPLSPELLLLLPVTLPQALGKNRASRPLRQGRQAQIMLMPISMRVQTMMPKPW